MGLRVFLCTPAVPSHLTLPRSLWALRNSLLGQASGLPHSTLRRQSKGRPLVTTFWAFLSCGFPPQRSKRER